MWTGIEERGVEAEKGVEALLEAETLLRVEIGAGIDTETEVGAGAGAEIDVEIEAGMEIEGGEKRARVETGVGAIVEDTAHRTEGEKEVIGAAIGIGTAEIEADIGVEIGGRETQIQAEIEETEGTGVKEEKQMEGETEAQLWAEKGREVEKE